MSVLDGPWELTRDGYGVWSEEAFTIILWTAHNPKTRTKQARDVARLACAAPDLLRELRHLVRLAEERTWPSEVTLNGARAAIARAEGEGGAEG